MDDVLKDIETPRQTDPGIHAARATAPAGLMDQRDVTDFTKLLSQLVPVQCRTSGKDNSVTISHRWTG